MMMTVGEFLARQDRTFPKPDAQGRLTLEDFERAQLPMVVACTECGMTMVLSETRACDNHGRIFCSTCATE